MRLLPLIVLPLASARVVRNQQQTPITLKATGDLEADTRAATEADANELPSIGVHFTSSYAVAAARYQNGTTQELVRVDGDAQYIELMRRWMSTRNSVDVDCRWTRSMRKASRTMRTYMGFPSEDTTTLSRFLNTVKESTKEALGGVTVTSIAPAMFPLGETQKQDVSEALHLVGLESTRSQWQDDMPAYFDVNAAYAGLGFGLCTDYKNAEICTTELSSLPMLDVLFLDMDNSSFVATSSQLYHAYDERSGYNSFFNHDLGWWNLPMYEVPRAKFWANVHEVIVDAVSIMPRPPVRIVLMGEHGADAEFQEVVKAALWSVSEVDVELLLEANEAEEISSRTAKGAAELAFREKYWTKWDGGSKTNDLIEL